MAGKTPKPVPLIFAGERAVFAMAEAEYYTGLFQSEGGTVVEDVRDCTAVLVDVSWHGKSKAHPAKTKAAALNRKGADIFIGGWSAYQEPRKISAAQFKRILDAGEHVRAVSLVHSVKWPKKIPVIKGVEFGGNYGEYFRLQLRTQDCDFTRVRASKGLGISSAKGCVFPKGKPLGVNDLASCDISKRKAHARVNVERSMVDVVADGTPFQKVGIDVNRSSLVGCKIAHESVMLHQHDRHPFYRARIKSSNFSKSRFPLASHLFVKSSQFDHAKIFSVDSIRPVEDIKADDSSFVGVRFPIHSLEHSHFRRCNMQEASFRGVPLRDVSFAGSDLRKVDFENARFFRVNFRGANLEGANFKGAVFQGCKVPVKILKGATGLKSCRGLPTPSLNKIAGIVKEHGTTYKVEAVVHAQGGSYKLKAEIGTKYGRCSAKHLTRFSHGAWSYTDDWHANLHIVADPLRAKSVERDSLKVKSSKSPLKSKDGKELVYQALLELFRV